MKLGWTIATTMLLVGSAIAASKPHVVAFGKWTTIKWQPAGDASPEDLKIRPLLVDGKTKEFTVGPAHDVTDRTFVVQRIVRVNDSLPEETGASRWIWQKGGWLLMDRISARLRLIALPEFDPYNSHASWFRDYVAYCAISDDRQKSFAVIAQIGNRRPLLKKPLNEANVAGCSAPVWQRNPVRVAFSTNEDPKLTFTVNSRFVDLAIEDESAGEE